MPCCPANIRETKIAFGFKPQTAVLPANSLHAANLVADMWSLTKTNATLSVINPVNENDAMDIGKGDEFPANIFPSHLDTAVSVEKYVSSEFLAWLFSFTTGNVTKVAAETGWKYTAIPSDPVVSCIQLPSFTWAELIRPNPNSVVDRAVIGMVVNDWTLTMESGPGRNNCRVASNFVGCGKFAQPSTYAATFPAVTAEHFLNAASATININGLDYVLAQSFISLEFGWNNNVRLDTGIYPGSGTRAVGAPPSDYAIRGRMEYGNRECTLRFTARACLGSPEYTNLFNRTEAATIITLKGAVLTTAAYHSMEINLPRTMISSVVNGEADGLLTVECTVTVLKTAGATPYASLIATTTKNNILNLTAEGELLQQAA